jgi:hypothetical protein
MSEPWRDYAAAQPVQTDGPWSDYDMTGPSDRAPAKKTPSAALGFRKGVLKPILNGAMAVENVAQRAGLDTDRLNHETGFMSAREMADANAKAIESDPHHRSWMPAEIAGNIFGAAPLVAASKGPLIADAATGALLTDSRDPAGVALDAGIGAGIGWLGRGVMNKLGNVFAPEIDPAARRLVDKGVKVTPGMERGGAAMRKEDKMMSRPFVGDAIQAGREATQRTFNRAAVDEALAPLGKKVPSPIREGHDAVSYAKDEIGRAYDTVIPHLKVQLDGRKFAQAVMPAAQSLPAAQQKEFQRLVSLNLKSGQLSGQELKKAQGELRRLAAIYGRSQNAHEQELGRALGAADEELTANMLAQNPAWAPDLQKVNEAYRGYRIVADAAGRGDEGLFNTSQLKQSVRRGDFSKSKDATARGEAFMQDFSEDARKIIPARVPNSGTADRQPKNIFAALGGAKDLAFYTADDMLQPLRFAPRPRIVRRAGAGARRLAGPAAAGSVALAEQPSN